MANDLQGRPPNQNPNNANHRNPVWPYWVIGALLIAALLGLWHPWTRMVAGPHPSPTPPHAAGKHHKSGHVAHHPKHHVGVAHHTHHAPTSKGSAALGKRDQNVNINLRIEIVTPTPSFPVIPPPASASK